MHVRALAFWLISVAHQNGADFGHVAGNIPFIIEWCPAVAP
jgi:hypothetical protein